MKSTLFESYNLARGCTVEFSQDYPLPSQLEISWRSASHTRWSFVDLPLVVMAASRFSALVSALLVASVAALEAKSIQDKDWVHLRHAVSGLYFKDVESAGAHKGWPHGRLGMPVGKFQIELFSSGGEVHGDALLRLKSNTTSKPGYNYMFPSAHGAVYFGEDEYVHEEQWWKVSKVAGVRGDVLRSGDTVTIANAHSEGAYLAKAFEDYVYALDMEDKWVIELADK